MTDQEIFDFVVKHLAEQGGPSLNIRGINSPTPICLYRGHNGRRCAVGCLIADDEYTVEMDDMAVGGGVESIAQRGLLPRRLSQSIDLLTRLQNAHDYASFDRVTLSWVEPHSRRVGIAARLKEAAGDLSTASVDQYFPIESA